jgi:hypothetical protein
VNFNTNGVSGPSSPNDGKSRPGWPIVSVLLFCIVFFGYRALLENDSASRQQTSFGTIIQCGQAGRGNDYYCHYTFSVGDEQYAGVSKTVHRLGFGEIAIIYYDSQDPRINALEKFSEQSRTNMHFVYFLLLMLAATVGFILWNRTPYRP